MKCKLNIITGACVLLMLMMIGLSVSGCGNGSEVELDDTSDQVLPGEDWKGVYKDVDSTYVNIDSLSDTDRLFPKETIFTLEIDVSGIAYLTMDPNTANTLARKADDYTRITTFDVKWTEDGDSLIMHAPDTNIKQMILTRVEDSDKLELELQYETTSETRELEPVETDKD